MMEDEKINAAIELMYRIKDICDEHGANYNVTFTRSDNGSIDVALKINKHFSSRKEPIYDEKTKDKIKRMTGRRPK